ncbi:MAG: hypothetical protein PHD02_03995 [Bacilli bacterium]|nr:hypothetical protein [Bacilli bacterium]
MKKKKYMIFIIALFISFAVIPKVDALSINPFIPVLDGGVSCEVIGGEVTAWVKNAFKIVQYVGVGLAVVLTAVDFIQVIGGSKDDDLKKAFDRSVKRLIAVVLLLLTAVIVNFIVSTFIDPVVDTDIPNCVEDA